MEFGRALATAPVTSGPRDPRFGAEACSDVVTVQATAPRSVRVVACRVVFLAAWGVAGLALIHQ
jgi:hypothetical protein